MTKKRRDSSARYRVWLKPSVHKARRHLPGNVRQRIKRLIDGLGNEPRPANSRGLQWPEGVSERVRQEWDVRRARIDDWRVVYGVNDTGSQVGVLLVAKRPPYRYEDLESLLQELDEAP